MRHELSAQEAASMGDLAHALHRAAIDLHGFTCSVLVGHQERAEELLVDVLLLALESEWFTPNSAESGRITHQEFREELFALAWKKASEEMERTKDLTAVSAARFYQLPAPARAAVYLRGRCLFSSEAISRILQFPNASEIDHWVEKGREVLLGRRVYELKEDSEEGGVEV